MTDLLRLGAYSIQALQQGLTTTGHNIANAGTEGYSRQTVNYETQSPQRFGFGFIGTGARVASVERAFNGFLTDQVRSFTSSASQHEVFAELSSRIEHLFADGENSLNNSLQRLFDATSGVAANPTGIPERDVLLSEARSLISRHQTYQSLLQDVNRGINEEIRASVDEINNVTTSLVRVNQQVVQHSASGTGVDPNDLLDERDRLLEKLAGFIEIQVVEQTDSSINVMIGSGQALVIGGQANKLAAVANSSDASKLEIGMLNTAGSSDGSFIVNGGELQGLLDFRNRVLEPVESHLGLMALGLTDAFNTQHQLGVDLNGNAGLNFFQPQSFSIAASSDNAGSSVPTVSVTDSSAVKPSAYSVSFDGAQWQMTRLSDGTSVVGAGILNLDGLSVDVTAGVPVAGDKFVFNPGKQAGASFNLAISDPRAIAAAGALVGQAPLGNSGSGAITDIAATPVNTLPLAGSITLTFDPDAIGPGIAGFNITGGPGGTIAFDPAVDSAGKAFNFAAEGIDFTLSGVPIAGDSFVLSNNVSSLADTGNILALGQLQTQKLVNGGENSLQEMYGATATRVGVNSSEASRNLAVETALREQAVQQRESGRGVNLDEEAANLLQLQQAYQASAQLIKVADDLFQTLISSVR